MRRWRSSVAAAGVLLALTLAMGAEDTRGIKKVVVRDREGRPVGLYKGSYALLVGVSDYTAGWPDLRSIPEELDTVEDALERRGFLVRKLLNPDAAAMRSGYRDFIGDYGYDPDNRLLFFFSGHGFSRSGGTKGYLVPADAPVPEQDLRGFLRKALGMGQILTWAREMDSKHALFLFDSCFSGTIFKSKALPVYPPHISSITSRPVRLFITAGDAGETVPAKSVFTPMFVRALDGEADMSADGYVTGTELGMYLRDKVLSYRTGQTPQFDKIRDPDLDEGDFVFVVRHAGGSEPERREDEAREADNTELVKKLERERRELELERAKLLAEAERLRRERSELDEQRKLKEEARKIDEELAARDKASGTIEDLRIEHDRHRDGQRGMLIHAKITIGNHRDKEARVVAYFNKRDGSPLKDFNESYHTEDGQVSVGEDVVPIYDSSTWNDFVLFMPYGELHMTAGHHLLKLFMNVWDTSTSPAGNLAESGWLEFEYTETKTQAFIESIRTDYDVYEAGRKGIRVHAHFNIVGLNGGKAAASIYFHESDGTKLQDTDDAYAAGDGHVATSVALTPEYEDTTWKDLTIFMPYRQLHRPVGKHSLKYDLYIWDQSGEEPVKLTESDWQTFDFRETGKWATLDDIRIEHNVHQGEQKGMRLHSRVNIAGLLSKEAEVAAYFFHRDGDALKDFDDLYETTDDKVAVHDRVTCTYEVTEWKDFKLFMPYDQLHLGKGETPCQFYLAVWDRSGPSAVKLVESDWNYFNFSM